MRSLQVGRLCNGWGFDVRFKQTGRWRFRNRFSRAVRHAFSNRFSQRHGLGIGGYCHGSRLDIGDWLSLGWLRLWFFLEEIEHKTILGHNRRGCLGYGDAG